MRDWRVPEAQTGSRLDQALGEVLPELGIRGRRRFIANSGLLLNGRSAKASSRVESGDLVQIPQPTRATAAAPGAFLLAWREPYCFFYKPAGLHTARVSASGAVSLEDALDSLIPREHGDKDIHLLQRLDFGTSGIVAAALSQKAEEDYRQWEREGRISKYYLAFLEGSLEKPVCIDRALDTAKRRKSRVLEQKSGRSTFITPLHVWENGSEFPLPGLAAPKGAFTLAGCRLSSGQRHQIRTHAAWLGHPLVGDSLYGRGGGSFILQHFALDFPGYLIQLDGAEFLKNRMHPLVQEAISAWLAQEGVGPS